jgi:predicted transcriptional regulator
MIPTGEQLRAARALLRMEQRGLAEASGVSLETIKRLEGIKGPISANAATVEKITKALEAAGVLFIPENGEGAGVRLRRS